ncbi:MAG: pentapeptide repeat-containing protein [Clostridia bacterium]|nr:pentapeptide repeat-containing protein [Clostridia bacterium]
MRNYIPVFTDEETDNVLKKLKPSNSKACNDNLLWGSATSQAYSGKYHGYSFKRSNLYKVAFSSAEFDHCNFTGSILKEVIFESTCNFSSVNFQRSILDGCSFNSEETMHALNFSACILDNVDFSNNTIRGSYFNNAKINNCRFNNTVIRSTSFDNCIIKNSSFLNCNMKNLNLEFSTFINVDLENAQISFYQLPYIIGIFNEPNRLKNLLIGCGEGKTINFSDYVHNIQDSIVYFTNKNQFLPLANLYYLKGDYNIAKNCILSGVENSLLRNDYTLIKYLIKLAIILKLLDYSEINHLLNKVDLHLNKIKDDENYTYYLLQSFEMQIEHWKHLL